MISSGPTSMEIRPRRLLIVEEHPDLCRSLRDLLTDAGYEVASCTSRDQALSELRRTRFSLVIVDDWFHDGETGTALLRRAIDAGLLETCAALLLTPMPRSCELPGVSVAVMPTPARALVERVHAVLADGSALHSHA